VSTTLTGRLMILEILYYETRLSGGLMLRVELADHTGRTLSGKDGIPVTIDWSFVDEEPDVASLERDGLVVCHDDRIELTWMGELFVRSRRQWMFYHADQRAS